MPYLHHWKMVLGVKGGRFDPWGKPTPKEHTHHGNTFLGALSENPCCGRVEGNKIFLSMRGYNFTPMPIPHSTPHLRRPPILHVRSDCGRNQTCQNSSESVQGFRSPRWPIMTLLYWLGTSPLQQCYTVMITIGKLNRKLLTSVGWALAITKKTPACSELLIHIFEPLIT